MKKKEHRFIARSYPSPVNELLKLGRAALDAKTKSDYLALGLSADNRADLQTLALDFDLFCQADEPEVYGPIHAWRALGQLHHPDDLVVLAQVLMIFEDTDWANEELPTIFAQFGAAALPQLAALLGDENNKAEDGDWPRITAAECLPKLAEKHPETRAECVQILTEQLKKHAQNSPDLNGFLVSNLLDLDASESLTVIDAAYTAGHVEESICGDLPAVRAEFGLLPPGQAPKPQLLGSKKFPLL